MENKLNNLLINLKKCNDGSRANEALQTVKNICSYFDNDLTNVELDYALEVIFNDLNGTIVFLRRSLRANKIFKASNEHVLEFYLKLINSHKEKCKKYIKIIVTCLLSFIASSVAGAKEKELSVKILHEIVLKQLCDEDNISIIVVEIFKALAIKTTQNRFLQNIYKLLGTLCQNYPTFLTEHNVITLKDAYFSTLEKVTINMEHVSFEAMIGALEGLSLCFINFAPSDGSVTCLRIYEIIKKLADPGEEKRKELFRGALNFMATHSHLIREYLFNDNVFWHNLLLKWIAFPTLKDRTPAINAIYALHRQISSMITKNYDEKKDETLQHDNRVLEFFIKYFIKTLLSTSSLAHEIRIAIRGLSVMASNFKTHLAPHYLQEVLMLIINRTEYIYMDDSTRMEKQDVLEHLADFVQALSQIMRNIDLISSGYMSSLEKIIIALIRDFHYLSSYHHSHITSSLMETFYNISQLGGTILNNLFDKVILQGVVWTCSHKTVYDAQSDWDTVSDWKQNVTIYSYLPLWNGLLAKKYDAIYSDITSQIYDNLINNLFIILNRLNLNTKKRTFNDIEGNDQEFYFCDPNIDLLPCNTSDMEFFFNLVEFYKNILYKSTPDRFIIWINVFYETIITKSIKYPLISGFHKLLCASMTICSRLNYFNELNTPEKCHIFNLVFHYLNTIIMRVQQSSGELQISCLELLLATPIELLYKVLANLAPIFTIAFSIGKNEIKYATMAITVLEKLIAYNESNKEECKRLLKEVLPCLDSFLRSKDLLNSQIKYEVIKQGSKWRTKKKINRLDGESDLVKLQKRILIFLGTLEIETCLYMIPPLEYSDENLTKVTDDFSIKLELYFDKIQPSIDFITILPRIKVLALSCSDRQIKISASELIHALILYVIGQKSCDEDIFLELCSCSIQLGCDTDTAVQQMFEPLLMQIMHYYSQPSQILTSAVEVLLGCLMNFIAHPNNCAVRDLSARCLRELVVWSIRQVQPNQLSASNLSFEIIIRHLKAFSADPNGNKRIGSALAFNNLYRVLRQEESIINIYWLELFYVYCMSFIMSEEMKNSNNALFHIETEQISVSLDHIINVFNMRTTLFNRISGIRKKPQGFEGITLKDVASWLFKQCASKQAAYRHKCIEMFMKIAPRVDGYTTVQEFITKTQTAESIRNLCESTPNIENGIKQYPNLSHLKYFSNKYKIIQMWLESMLASTDFLVWLLANNFLTLPADIIQSICIFNVINYYLEEICELSLPELIEKHSQIMDRSGYGITEIENIKTINSLVLIKLLELFINLLSKHSSDIPTTFWQNKNLTHILINLIFRPHMFGYDITSKTEVTELPNYVEKFLIELLKHGNQEYLLQFTKEMSKEIQKNIENITNTTEHNIAAKFIPIEHVNLAKGVEMVYRNFELFNFHKEIRESFKIFNKTLLNYLSNGIIKETMDIAYPIFPVPCAIQYLYIIFDITVRLDDNTEEIFKLLLNNNELKSPQTEDSKCCLMHGEHFFNTYKQSIIEFFLRSPKKSIVSLINFMNSTNSLRIVRILSSLSEYAYKKNTSDDICSEIYQAIGKHFQSILKKVNDYDNLISGSSILVMIELMTNVGMLNSNKLSEMSQNINGFTEWLLKIIKTNNSTKIKSSALHLLPSITNKNENSNELLENALQTLQEKHFPLQSNKLPSDSMERTDLIAMLREILNVLIVSQSPVILKFLIQATAADENHIMETQIRQCLNDFIHIQNEEYQIKSINIAFENFCLTSLEPSVRIVNLKRFLATMIVAGSNGAIITFYTENIKKIDSLINMSYTFGQNNTWNTQHGLVSRMGGYYLFELLFGAIPKEILSSEDNTIGCALLGENNGNKLIGNLSKNAYKTRSEKYNGDDDNCKELFRKYQCASYRALCTLICNSKNELKFYNLLLFKEDTMKNDIIWQNLINCKSNFIYTFTQECENYPKYRDKIVSIRKSNVSTLGNVNIQYLESLSVFDSSLSQDITKFDLTHTSVRTANQVALKKSLEKYKSVATVKLERTPINDHEVMAVLCAVITHMFDTKITIIPVNAEEARVMSPPIWITMIANVISDSYQHINVRLFMAKVVENCRHLLHWYAPFLLGSILQLIVDVFTDKTMNNFIIDLIAMMLTWNDIYSPTKTIEINHIASIIKFLMLNAYHENREVFKLNIELIKSIVEIWTGSITLPLQLLFDSISPVLPLEATDNRNKVMCGIQLNAIVLANNLLPWSPQTKGDYIKTIMQCLDSEERKIYEPAGQLLGMCLNNLDVSNNEYDKTLEASIIGRLHTLLKKYKQKIMYIIYGIQKHYPSILNHFLVIISNNIPNVSGSFKSMHLEMFLSRIEFFSTKIYREIITIGIQNLLSTPEFQLIALHIINKALPLLLTEEINSLIDYVCVFEDSKHTDCRDIMYEILIQVRKSVRNTEINKRCKSVILNGLTDADQNIQKRILSYWINEANIPTNIDDRLLLLFRDLYLPECENKFLNACIQLLLEPVIQNPSCKIPIFAISNQNFQEYDINTNVKRLQTLPPLFSETQRRNLIFGEGSVSGLRATNDGTYEPTLDPMAASSTANVTSNFSLNSHSSLLFTIQRENELDRRSCRISRSTTATSPNFDPTEQSLNHLRKRIVKITEKEKHSYAIKAIEKSSFESNRKKQLKEKKNIILYRRYRYGDFPDTFITVLAFLLPLCAVAKYDQLIAQQIFINIFLDIVNKMDNESKDIFLKSISESVQEIFKCSKMYEPGFRKALIEIALNYPKVFVIEPEIIKTVAITCNATTNAILYLENRLIANDDSDYVESENSETLHWLQLSVLYRSLSEFDIVAAIYSNKMRTHPQLSIAIELEGVGNFSEASREYHKLINNNLKPYEQDFCIEGVNRCLVEMSNWSSVNKVVKQQIDGNLEILWSDDWYQHNLLPLWIRAELRMIFDEKEALFEEFQSTLESWLRSTDRSEYIKYNFSDELVMLLIANKDYQYAKLQSEQFLLYFITEWNNLNNFSQKLRKNTIINSYTGVNIIPQIDVIQKLTINKADKMSLNQICQHWENSVPNKVGLTLRWDSLITYRRFICNHMCELISDNCLENQEFINKLKNVIWKMDLLFFDTAFSQNNISLANNIVRRLKDIPNYNGNDDDYNCKQMEWAIIRSKYQLLKAKGQTSFSTSMDTLVDSWQRINETLLTTSTLKENRNLRAKSLEVIHLISSDMLDKIHPDIVLDNTIINFIQDNTKHINTENLVEKLYRHSLWCIQTTTDLFEGTNGTTRIGELYFTMFEYCYRNYNYNNLIEKSITDEKVILLSILRSMKNDHQEARQMFPYILQLKNLQNNNLLTEFNEESVNVPAWMFLNWIPQILSNLNFINACYLDNLIMRIAEKYQNTLIYPFRISYKQNKSLLLDKTSKYRDFIENIKCKITNNITEKFIDGLNCLVIPEYLLQTYLKSLINLIEKTTAMNNDQFSEEIAKINEEVFPENSLQGGAYDRIKNFQTELEFISTYDIITERNKIQKSLKIIYEKLSNYPGKEKIFLLTLCPWLNKYQWCGIGDYIELPGQYNNNCCPNIGNTVKIVKFNEEIMVLKSLQKVLKFSLLCDNGITYSYIMKVGSDLRLDQRIQQILSLMSRQLENDSKCRNHDIKIRTYAIVPISMNCGMISWIKNTKTLTTFIDNYGNRDNKEFSTLRKEQMEKYKTFLKKPSIEKTGSLSPSLFDMYGTAANFYTRIQIMNNFREVQYKISSNVFLNAIKHHSVSAQSYFILRNNVITTLSALSIAGWILGIGDRHLSNILIDEKTGQLIGIDYTIAFDSGNELPVPELTPYRLTPQLQHLLEPFGVNGLFSKCMKHILHAFRHSKNILLACLEVFIQEPTLDWNESAREYAIKIQTENYDYIWNASEKIKIVHDKLSGANPRAIVEAILKNGCLNRNPAYLKGYLNILMGSKQDNVRSRLANENLTVEEQINCLNDMATDPYILGILYSGFESWI